MNTDTIKYYSERAIEYESIYLKPERQEKLKHITIFIAKYF